MIAAKRKMAVEDGLALVRLGGTRTGVIGTTEGIQIGGIADETVDGMIESADQNGMTDDQRGEKRKYRSLKNAREIRCLRLIYPKLLLSRKRQSELPRQWK